MHIVFETVQVLGQVMWAFLVAGFKAIWPFQKFKDVSGQLVLVTGAGSGIGRLMALRFADRGSHLVLWDVNEESNKATAELVRQKGVKAFAYRVDLSDRESIYQTASKVKMEAGDVDILINNAGIVTGKTFLECPDELIEKTMAVNINAHFWTVKSFLPAMMAKDKGHVVTIASSGGLVGIRGLSDYCASKFAAVGFDESLRNELWGLGKRGVKTTVICPYYINTGMFDGASTRFPLMLPILQPDWAVSKIMEAILTDSLMLVTPFNLRNFTTIRTIIPYEVAYILGDFFGTNWSMNRFVGRKQKAT